MSKMKRNKGITLIALVVTIIVLLILAGVSIAALTGENGLIYRTNKSREKTEEANIREAVNLELQNYKIEQTLGTNINCRDFLSKQLKTETIGENSNFSFILKDYLVSVNGTKLEIISIVKFNLDIATTYPSIEDMQKDTSIKEKTYVRTLGYYNQDIGGDAYYQIVNDKHLVADNRKTIALNNGLYALLYPINNMVAIKQLGAYGDGIQNETETLQYAISNFDKLYISDGKYIISNTINIDNNISIQGSGSSEILANFSDSLINFSQTLDNVTIESVNFDGIQNVENRKLLNIYGNNITIKNCTFENASNSIYLNSVNNYILENNEFKDNIFGICSEYLSENGKIINNSIHDNQRNGIDMISDVQNVEIKNNNIYDNGGSGIECNGGIFSNFIVSENLIENNGYAGNLNDLNEGINFHGIKNSTITKNKIINNAINGIDIDGTDSSTDYRTENVLISENYIKNNGTSNRGYGSGIIVWSCKSINIEKNQLINNHHSNIVVGSESDLKLMSTDIMIDANQMHGVTRKGSGYIMSLSNAVLNLTIENNMFDAMDNTLDRRIISINTEKAYLKNIIIGKNDYFNFTKDNTMHLQGHKEEINPINISTYETKEFDSSNISAEDLIKLDENRNTACWLKSAKIVCLEDSSLSDNSNIKLSAESFVYIDEQLPTSMKRGDEKTLNIQKNGSISSTLNELSIVVNGLSSGKFKLVLEICYDVPMYY